MFLKSMQGIIEQLDGERFEPVILCSQAIVKTLQTKNRREGPAFILFWRLTPGSDPAGPRGGLRPDLLLGSGQRRDELFSALRAAGAGAMHRLGLNDHQSGGTGRRLFPFQ